MNLVGCFDKGSLRSKNVCKNIFTPQNHHRTATGGAPIL
ncbi:MAG: hypothetical protein ACI9JY_002575 [Saprospiraceae bacterium]|jgi:hypothetical protein